MQTSTQYDSMSSFNDAVEQRNPFMNDSSHSVMNDSSRAFMNDSSFFNGSRVPDDSFSSSSYNSNDSPSYLNSAEWSCAAQQQEFFIDYPINQEQPLLVSRPVKMEPLSDSETMNEDEYKQMSMNSPFSATAEQTDKNMQLLSQSQNSVANPEEQQQPQPSFFNNEPVCNNGSNTVADCPMNEATFNVEKANFDDAITRRKPYRTVKIPDNLAGSPPLPPQMELPAILGGKLPPRTFKAGSKKKHVFTERELRSRRKRGLPDDSDSESEERRLVRLPRRSLLAITTPQMSHFIAFMRSNVKLTPSQEDELSRQKRLVKNRECACRFRAKKELSLIEYRDRVSELESDLEALRAENERLRQALKEQQPTSFPQ